MLVRGLAAQTAPNPALTINQAVDQALKTYPSIHVSQEQMNAAAAGIRLARTAYLPHVDAIAQVDRATRNNVFGMVFPQSALPSISGPVIGSNNFGTVWGSAAGALVSWEPFDFGSRQATVAVAAAARGQSEAALTRTRFEVAVSTADAYLTLLASQETVRAAQAGVDRADSVLRMTRALVDAQLRPGADASRSEAELAAARTELIRAQEAAEIARATVAQFVGGDPAGITLGAARLLDLPPEEPAPPLDPAKNPIAAEQNAALEQIRAQLRLLERAYFPRFFAQASAYARGTGAEINGARMGGLNGLAPTVQNYGVALTVTFPVLDLSAIRARQAAQSATVRAETARLEQIATELRAQWNRAVAGLEGSRRIVANTPVQTSAALAATQQAMARYQSGLGTIDQVADADRLLTQSEIDDALARLGVWRGMLGVAAAAGDIQPFLTEASQ
jgi:outer membrane protein